ncbi:MAG: agmatinase, partial [Petrimonas sp.]|nr:agmatinase [Petrimonas sp.]
MLNKNIVHFVGCDADYQTAETVLFGAPYDGTTSFRPGTRFAPMTIRNESMGLETYSPYQDADLTDSAIMDSGDLQFTFGSSRRMLDQIYERTAMILKDGKRPFMIGGEHLVTLGAVEAAVQVYPDLHIVHFDAHTDLRQSFFGEVLSHATVLKRCHDLVGDGKIFQFGIRSGDGEEFRWSKAGHTYMNPFNFNTLDEILESLKGKPVYFTLDLDVMDPSVLPGTGTPEA